MGSNRVHIHSNPAALNRAVAARIVALGREALGARGRFDLALAGGSTPRGIYTLLATPAYAPSLDWRRTHLFFGDERYVPPDHPDSNYRMARETLIDHVPVPADHVHPIPTDSGDAAVDAERYAQCLRRVLPQDATPMPVLDLMLLGIGEDGHTASLFPQTPILNERSQPAAAVYVPALQTWRISMTPPVIERARRLLFVAAGASKAGVVGEVLGPGPGAAALPVQQIRPRGESEWHLDTAAAGQLKRETT